MQRKTLLLLVESSVMRSLVQTHNLALVLHIPQTPLKKTVDFSCIVSGVLTVNQQLSVCYLVVLVNHMSTSHSVPLISISCGNSFS